MKSFQCHTIAAIIVILRHKVSSETVTDNKLGDFNNATKEQQERSRRGLYGVEKMDFCPPECLCLSEIQVKILI